MLQTMGYELVSFPKMPQPGVDLARPFSQLTQQHWTGNFEDEGSNVSNIVVQFYRS